MKIGIIEKYKDLLRLPTHTASISLGEGETPLISIPKIARELGGGFELYVKYEGLNPTGSFKDRGMVAAVGEALGAGAKTIICASTGNTAASAAAYAARAGMKAIVLIPEGKVARGKLVASFAYGAKIVQLKGSFDDALRLVIEISRKHNIALVNSVNPFRLEGQKTAAFEIVDELGDAPDWLCLPIGNAGNISAYAMGFEQYHNLKKSGIPKFLGVQAEGSAPLVLGKIIYKPETIATAIRIGNPARGQQAVDIVKNYGGKIIAVTDAEILNAQKILLSEGIWVEPASAAGLAGFIKEVRENKIDVKGKKIVIVCTGHGLKDPDIIEMPMPILVEPTLEVLEKMILV
jgi:threonine synthase